MSDQQVTGWFLNGEKPVRKGVYQQKNGPGQLGYQYWDGVYWHGWAETAQRSQE